MAVGAQPKPTIPFRYGAETLYTPMDTRSNNYATQAGGGLVTPWDIPRQGFFKRLRLMQQGTNVTGGTAPTLHEDYPWAATKQINVKDPGGNSIYSASGFQSFLLSKFFSGRAGGDISLAGDTVVYTAPNAISSTNLIATSYILPLVINDRDTLGVLPNQDPKRGYTLEVYAEALAAIATANPPTTFTLNTTPVYEYFAPPPPMDPYGNPYQQVPDYIRAIHKYASSRFNVTNTGSKAVTPHLKTGDLFRGLGLVFRSNGTRATYATTPFTALRVFYGNGALYRTYVNEQQLRSENYERLGQSMPAGCYYLDFTFASGLRPGNDTTGNGRQEVLNTANLSDVYIEVDLPAGFNVTNSWLEVLADTIQAPKGMVVM